MTNVYVLGYYKGGKFITILERDSLSALWQVKKRLEARRPQVKLEIKKKAQPTEG